MLSDVRSKTPLKSLLGQETATRYSQKGYSLEETLQHFRRVQGWGYSIEEVTSSDGKFKPQEELPLKPPSPKKGIVFSAKLKGVSLRYKKVLFVIVPVLVLGGSAFFINGDLASGFLSQVMALFAEDPPLVSAPPPSNPPPPVPPTQPPVRPTPPEPPPKEDRAPQILPLLNKEIKATALSLRENKATLTLSDRTGLGLLEFNRLVREAQGDLLTHLGADIKYIRVVVSQEGNSFSWETPSIAVRFIRRLSQEDRHSSQLWWSRTNFLRNGVNMKNTPGIISLYVPTIQPLWDPLPEDIPAEEIPPSPPVDTPEDPPLDNVFGMSTFLTDNLAPEHRDFRLSLFHPDALTISYSVQDGRLEVRSEESTPLSLRVVVHPKDTPLENKEIAFEARRDALRETKNLSLFHSETVSTYILQNLHVEIYHVEENGKEDYLYHVLTHENERVFEVIIRHPAAGLFNLRDLVNQILTLSTFGNPQREILNTGTSFPLSVPNTGNPATQAKERETPFSVRP